jgi:hypothetical protein
MRRGYDAEVYAEDIGATQAVGEAGESWFAAQLPTLEEPVPS